MGDEAVWLFRERLTQVGAIEIPFNRFDAILRNAGDLADVRPDPGCYAGRGSEAAQYERGESGSSGGTDPTELAGQTGKAVAQGPSCAMDAEVHEGKAAG